MFPILMKSDANNVGSTEIHFMLIRLTRFVLFNSQSIKIIDHCTIQSNKVLYKVKFI